MRLLKFVRLMFTVVLVTNMIPTSGFAQSNSTTSIGSPVSQQPSPLKPITIQSIKNDTSPPLRSIAPKKVIEGKQATQPIYQLPKAEKSLKQGKPTAKPDMVQNWIGDTLMPSPLQNFEGVNNVNAVLPPDTQGDVGPNHYVQWVNLSFAIWDKSGNLLYGPAAGNTLWSGFGGTCESNNDGDVITLYDPIADRWLMSQFALNFPNDFHQCVAISTTGDPTGSWHRYDFPVSTTKMNDYPKFGVWPDAYYMTANQFDGVTFNWAGAGVWAFERDKMLNGSPAQLVYFDLASVDINFGGMLPADLDGWTLPPTGDPGIFTEWDDGTWIAPHDALRIWEFHVDWSTPANSTFGLSGQPNTTINTMDVDPDMCGFARNCIPQPGGSALDAISDRLMYRLQYRNFGDYQTLVSNHTVDVDSADHAGIHWFELHDTGSGWSMYQEGVYAPDTDHRWMGSAALDQRGNLALGYSVSSSSTFPSIRYAGRLAGDPLGTLPQAETSLIAGSGYQQHTSGRWGDYSMLAVDPVDECTFWYTQEYYASVGNALWQTRIGSFQYPGCLGATGSLSGTVTESGSGTPIIDAKITAETNPTFVTFSQAPSGIYTFSAVPTGTYTVTASAYSYAPSSISGVEVYSGTITTQDFNLSPVNMYDVSGTVTDAATGWPLYASIDISAPGFPGANIWSDPVTGQYSITLAEGISYTFNVEAWVNGYLSEDRSVGPLTGNTTEDFSLIADQVACSAPGYEQVVTGLYEDFESWTPSGWTIVDNESSGVVWDSNVTWGDDNWTGGGGNSADVNSDSAGTAEFDTELVSPAISVASIPTTTLRYLANYQNLSGYDYLDLDINVDSGGWVNLLRWNEDHGTFEDTPGETVTIDLSSYLTSATNFQIRWHYYDPNADDWDWYAQIDEVRMGTLSCNPPVSGGLVVGNVYDDNTSAPLNAAGVENEDGYATTTQSTAADTAVDDGFYTLYSLAGTKTFTATMSGGYGDDVQTPTVVDSDTVSQDFSLPAGWLSYTPSGLGVTLGMGLTTTLPLTISNNGGLAASFEFKELDKGWEPMGPFEQPDYVVKPFKSNRLTTEKLTLLDPPEVSPYAAGDIIQSWSTGLSFAWGVGYNLLDVDLWLGDIAVAGGTDKDYRFLTDGTNTGDTIDISWADSFAADMAYNSNTYTLWQVNVGGDNCIYELDPQSQVPTGNTICPAWSTSMRGLAYDPTTDTYFAGSWNDSMIHHFSADGTMLDEVNVGLAIAGLAYNPDTQHLFVMVNDSPNPVYVLDVPNSYNNLGSFAVSGFSDYGGAGLGLDCNGNLWAVDQNTQTTYQFESGETTSKCNFDVPWLSEDPITGTLSTSSDMLIDVNFDSSGVPQPGDYYAQLKIFNDTPYALANVPVTMTVVAPPTWGKLEGTVTGLGHCDTNPNPLEGAQVHVDSSTPSSWDLETNADGYYSVWMDQTNNPMTVTVTYPDYASGLATGVMVSGQVTTTQDFDLRWQKPCVSTNPESLEASLASDNSYSKTLTIMNYGAVSTSIELKEQEGTPLSPTIPFESVDEDYPRGSSPSSTGRAPKAETPKGEQKPVSWLSPGAPAFGMDLLNTNLVSFTSDTPGAFNVIGSNGGGNYFAGDFLNGDFTKLYVVAYDTNQFGYFDTTTAAFTLIGTATPNSGETWTGLTGATDGTLYGVSTDISASTLYTIDPATAVATPIGAISNGPSIIDIAINPAGEIYGVDIVSDALVQINPATGAGTVIGSIGFDANYAQGMDFEEESNVLYLAAYNSTTSQGELRIADTTTGNTALVGPFQGGTEVDCLAFATTRAIDVPWLSEDPITATLSADSSMPVEIMFTAIPTMTAGIYTATLEVDSDDPINPKIDIPVTMTIVTEPVCSFTSTSPDDLGNPTIFTNTTDERYGITTYTWDFGDGSPTSSVKNPMHTYANPGIYNVTLTAVNIAGQDSCSANVEIDGIIAGFTSNSPVDLGDLMIFTNTTEAYPAVTSWSWDFGDGGTSAVENPTHMYTAPGTYNVTLTAENSIGQDTYIGHVQVQVVQYEIYLPIVVRNR